MNPHLQPLSLELAVLSFVITDLKSKGGEMRFVADHLKHVIEGNAPGTAGLGCVTGHLRLRHSSLRILRPQRSSDH